MKYPSATVFQPVFICSWKISIKIHTAHFYILQAAAVTLDTVADESRKMADGVARSPSRLSSRDGKICCYGDALSMIFLLACFGALLPTFRFSFCFSYFFPASRHVLSFSCPFVCAADICYSQRVRIL